MDPQRVLAGLLHLAERLGVEVKHRALRGARPSAGGLCRLNGKSLVLLNSKASPVDKSYALAEALRGIDLGALEVDDEIRSFLFDRGKRKPVLHSRVQGPGVASTAHRRRRATST